jgi:hypothetical protein
MQFGFISAHPRSGVHIRGSSKQNLTIQVWRWMRSAENLLFTFLLSFNYIPSTVGTRVRHYQLVTHTVTSSLRFFLISWCGMRLSPLGTSANIWPIVPAPDDRWWVWSSRWNENWLGKPKYSEKTCPSATLSATNPIWPDLGSNPGRRGGKPAANRLSYGTALRVHT